MPHVAILGSGQVAQVLGKGFAARGYKVTFGTRDPKAKKKELQSAVPTAGVATMDAAAKAGDLVVMAIHGTNVADAVAAAGPANLAGKLILDTSNPLDFGPAGAHKPASIPDSCLQVIQRAAPKARVVKAWNCVPGPVMVDPKFPGGPGDQFICGDDSAAKAEATRILQSFGWNALDVGDATIAPYVEGMGLAVINHGARANAWNWGLKLLHKP